VPQELTPTPAAGPPQAEEPKGKKKGPLTAERRPMKLAIVLSKGMENEEVRILTDSPVYDVIRFLKMLGIEKWELDTKGPPRLYYNGPDLYVAVGPLYSREEKCFLRRLSRCGHALI
jgi:hypothetical protein